MRFGITAIGAAAAAVLVVSSAHAATVTWNGGTGNWVHASNWVEGVVPEAGDFIAVNGGTVELWTGGPLNEIISNTTLSMAGGTISFPNTAHWVKVGTGGAGTSSSLIINGGTYGMKGGEFAVGNDSSGEAGLVLIADGGNLTSSNSAWINLEDTGTIDVAGNMTGFGSLNLMGGTINIYGGTFSASSVNFENRGARGDRFNIHGGTVTIGSVSTLQLGYGNRYFNFAADSTGTLIFPNTDVETVSGYIASSYIRLAGSPNADAFSVAPYGASGAQVSLVPEPGTVMLLAAAVGAIGLHRRSGAR